MVLDKPHSAIISWMTVVKLATSLPVTSRAPAGEKISVGAALVTCDDPDFKACGHHTWVVAVGAVEAICGAQEHIEQRAAVGHL